jgi:hypothetical protein
MRVVLVCVMKIILQMEKCSTEGVGGFKDQLYMCLEVVVTLIDKTHR